MPTSPSQTLTKAITYETNFPFPTANKDNEYEANLGSEGGRTITLETCSELMEYRFPVDIFSPRDDEHGRSSHLTLIHDKHNQPIIFTISTDGKLYLLAHVTGAPQGWQKFNITPPDADGFVLGHCDVLRQDQTVHLALTVSSAKVTDAPKPKEAESHSLWLATFDVPELSWSSTERRVEGFSNTGLTWSEIPQPESKKPIATISLCPGSPLPSISKYWVAVGTLETSKDQAVYYIVDPTPGVSNAWHLVTLAETGHSVVSVQSACLGNVRDLKKLKPGFATLIQRPGDAGYALNLDSFSGQPLVRGSTAALRIQNLGKVNAFCTNANLYGISDVYAATQHGIAFFDSQKLDQDPVVLLENISFRQVAVSEVPNKMFEEDSNIYARLSLLAVSEANELYFIQGIRDKKAKVTFPVCSGIAIRTGVRSISTQFNYGYLSSEILYVTETANELRHLVRNPTTSMWSEDTIHITSSPKETTYVKKSAHVTTITLTDGNGKAVPSNYPVTITGDRKTIYVDSKIIPLGPFPVTLTTSTVNGRIVIVAPAVDKVGAAPYQLTLSALKPPTPSHDHISVSPAQRVQSLMSGIKSGKDLAELKDSKGNKIFEGESEDNLSSVALLSGCVSDATNPPAAKVDAEPAGKTIVAGLGQAPALVTSSSKIHARRGIADDIGHWFEDRAHDVVEVAEGVGHAVSEAAEKVKKVGGKLIEEAQHCVGDLIEGIKKGVKALGSLAMQIVGPVLKLAVSIAGKVIGFALKGIGFVLKGVSAGLKALGVDTKKLDNWIEFLFDGDSTEKTQVVLKNLVNGCLKTSRRFLDDNRHTIHDFLLTSRQTVRSYLDQPIPPQQDRKAGKDNVISKIEGMMNNPVITTLMSYNPVSWIMEVVTESGEYKFPSKLETMFTLLSSQATDGMATVNRVLTALFEQLVKSLQQIAAKPSDIASILVSSLKSTIIELYDALVDVIDQALDVTINLFKSIGDFINEEWKLGTFTDLWKEFSGQNFTLLGFITYVMSTIVNLGCMLISSELPFRNGMWDDWDNLQLPRLGAPSAKTASQRMAVPTPGHSLGDVNSHLVADPSEKGVEGTAPKPTIHKRAAGRQQRDTKRLEEAETVIEVIGELICFGAAAREIFHLLKGGGHDSAESKNPKSQQNLADVAFTVLSGISMALTVTGTIMKFTVHSDQHGAVSTWPSYTLQTAKAGMTIIGFILYVKGCPAAGGGLQTGGGALGTGGDLYTSVADNTDQGIDITLLFIRNASALAGITGIIASSAKERRVAVISGGIDLAGCISGMVGAIHHQMHK